MQDNAKIVSVAASPVPPATAASSGGFGDSSAREDANGAARYRLVIEEGPNVGSFIYKTMDRVTGEVVRQFPREQLVKLMEASSYSAGSVIDTKA